ncbi:MAG: BCCT family transporter, partial [Rhodospirillaceae bacterium]|nr:BCCT family transporter [Rhodospirillaceae bacterium]
MQSQPQVDNIIFGASAGLIAAACIPIVLAPEQASAAVSDTYDFIAGNFGLLYQWMTLGAAVILGVLALGKYGNRRLGGPDARPAYSNISWMGMLFCAGIGGGLLYWSPIEWAYYLDSPPFGLDSGSAEAREWAATYGIFHWGFSAWCIYCLPTV